MTPELTQLLSHRPFTRFLLARFLGLCASQMLMVSLAWHMYDLTHSAWDLGLVGLFQFVPALLFTLPAGQLADRWHRGRIYASSVLLQGLTSLTLVGAIGSGFDSSALILALSVVLGVARAFQMPAQMALTPLLVPAPLLARAVA